jgi:hypothetical protein
MQFNLHLIIDFATSAKKAVEILIGITLNRR